MQFGKSWLQDLLWEEEIDGAEIIENEQIDNSRWSIISRLVFKYQGKFYATTYSRGATEMQDESPFEYEPDMIECKEVFPVEKTVIVYE